MKTKAKVSSKRIYEYYRELDKNGIENHGLLIMKNGETVFEEYAYPYCADMPHTLFSVTKSLVSTAAGFAISEGLFSLDSKILPFFSEYKHCESPEWDSLTVHSLLTMQSNKEFSFTQDMTGDYVEMFMKAPFRKKNRGFLYSNNDVHIVAALIQRLTGMNLVDYLTPRLFEPLGIEKPFWETDSKGECIGGTGAYLTLRDLAKISQCYGDGGRFGGVQVIPEEWTKKATEMHVPLYGRENEDGYGLLFWLKDGSFSMSGMFGQFITYYPQYNAVIASMNCAVYDEINTRLMREILTKALEEESDAESDKLLTAYLEGRGEKPAVCKNMPKIPTGKTFYMTGASDVIAKIAFPASLIPRSISSSFAVRPDKNLDRISFDLAEDELIIRWFEDEDEVTVRCGLDGAPRMSECSIKGYRYKIWAYAYAENGILKAVVKPLNTLSTQRINFKFNGDTLEMQMNGTPSFVEFICKNANQSSAVRNSGKLRPVIMAGIDRGLKKTEKAMIFKAKS